MRGGYGAIVLTKTPGELDAARNEFQDRINRIPVPGVVDGFRYAVITVKSDPFLTNFFSSLMGGRPDTKVAFFGAIAFMLLMLLGLPIVNLVNLNVSRIMERASEIGIRKAFGAPIRSLLWQFIIENIFVTFIGGAIALLLTVGIISLINSSGWIAYADLTVNVNVFIVSLLLCLVFGVLSGVLPAMRMSKLPIVEALKS